MPFIEWLTSFELGIPEFDEHHKRLVQLLDMTYDGITCGADQEELGAVLDELIDYATHHFAAEELWMTTHHYPLLTEHHKEHEIFRAKILEIQNDFHKGRNDLGIEVLQFLNSWVTDHILTIDAEYGRFAKEILEKSA